MGLFKRIIENDQYDSEEVIIDHIKMANYLIFLSQELNVVGCDFTPSITTTTTSNEYSTNRVFECKTCTRKFTSFQALGGHRASHKRSKLMTRDNSLLSGQSSSKPKVKTHECSICGLEFGIGQALGGHMRRHRGVNGGDTTNESTVKITTKSMSSKVNLCLDLNLTPLENDDLEFRISGKMAIASMVG